MTRPEELKGEEPLDREEAEVVKVARVAGDIDRLGQGAVVLERPDGSTYLVRYLELGLNLDDRFAWPTATDGSGDIET